MKTMTSTEAKQSFGKMLDMSQREPVVITKKSRPVSVVISIEDVETLASEEINAGIQRGLDNVQSGAVLELNQKTIHDLATLVNSDKKI